MNESIVSILKNFGWTEGFRIPVANKENRLLESEAEKVYEQQIQFTSNLKKCQDRLNLIKYYLNSVIEERKHYQEIHYASKEQEGVERSLCKRIATDKEAARNKNVKILKRKRLLHRDNTGLQIKIEKKEEHTRQMKDTLNWGKELEAMWIEYVQNENERVDLLKKWNAKGEYILQETEVKRSNLTAEKAEYDTILKENYQSILEAECSLHKLVTLQRKLRKEKTNLIAQWEWLIQVIATRDNEITRLLQEMTILVDMSTDLKNTVTEKKHFYDEQIRNNIQTDIGLRRVEIEIINRITCKENFNLQLKQSESKIVDRRRYLFALKVETSKKRTNIAETKLIVGRDTNIVHEITNRNERIVGKHLRTKILSYSVEERTQELNLILQDETSKLNILLSDCKKFEARLQKQKCSSTNIEKNLSMHDCEIKEVKHAKIVLDIDNQRCKHQIERHVNILVDLQEMIKLASQVQHLKGYKMNEMVEKQKKQLSNTTEFLSYQMKIFDQVNKDVEHFLLETTNLEKAIVDCTEQMNALQIEKEKSLLQIGGNEKQLNTANELNRQKLVSENVVRIRVDHLENVLTKSADKILDLQKQKVEIDTVLCKQNFEIQTASNILKTRKKLTNQEISDIKQHIEQIKKRIHQHMKRYEIITDSIKKDENGVSLNLVNYKIQMTRERYALLEKGDELDTLVRRAEQEIQAMENTLKLLNISNNAYKCNSSRGDESGKEMAKYENMKQKKFSILTDMRKMILLSEKAKTEILRYQSELSNKLQSKLHRLHETKKKKEAEYVQMSRILEDQYCKMNRVKARIKTVKKLPNINESNSRILEREFLSNELLKLNKRTLLQITQIINQYNELDTSVHRYLISKGISLP